MLLSRKQVSGRLVAITFLCVVGASPAQADQAAVVSELKAIREELQAIRQEVTELRKELKERDEGGAVVGHGDFRGMKASNRELGKIKLAENPTDDDVRAYITRILDASRGQNTFSTDDLQVSMLCKVGSGKLLLLIEALGYGNGGMMSSYHLEAAIQRLARDEHKDAIIEQLPFHHNLVKIVVQHGWERDARDTLVAALGSRPEHLPREWIVAVANLGDPALTPLLTEHFINCGQRYWTFQVIRDLDGIDMAHVVAEAWKRARYADDWEMNATAAIAARYGVVDALGVVISSLQDPQAEHYFMGRNPRSLIGRLTGIAGSSEEIDAWFRKNKDRLKFDPDTGKYTVQGK